MEALESLYGNLVAAARVNVGGTFSGALGFVSPAAPVASVYELTIDPSYQIDLTDSIILTSLPLPTGNASPVQADDNTINVSTFDVAGAPADRAFVIGVFSRRASPRRDPIGRLVAAAQVDAAGALVGKRFGVAAAPVLAASVYTYTFASGYAIDPTQGICFANAIGSTARYVGATIASDTTFGVATADEAGAAADIAHVVSVWRFA